MLDKSVVAILIILVGIAAVVQADQTVDPPFTGVVTGTNVYVRSGAGINHYPCMKLSSPEKVQVVGEVPGWYKIIPPKGSFSLISKKYVHVEGKTGTVTGTNVLVRAGSGLALYATRIESIQTKLNIGDRVNIIGQQGDYYKITPPEGVYLWISSRYVKPVGPTTRPSTLPATVTTQPTTSKTIVITTTQPETLRNELAEFESAEKAFQAEMKKPREARNLSALLERYRAIKLSAGSPLAPYVEARIRFLQGQIELLSDLREAERIIQDTDLKQAELAAQRERMKLAAPTTRPIRPYAAEGILLVSELFPGGPIGPKRYLLRDPNTHLIVSYVQCATGVIDLSKYIGALVRIIGVPRYDEHLRMYIIEAERVEVIRPAAKPKPLRKVKPITKPAPEPAPVKPVRPTQPTSPKPGPTPRTKPVSVPSIVPAPATRAASQPAAEPVPSKPVKPAPTTRPTALPAPEPTTEPAQTKPAEKPIPPTGLPVVEPTTQPSEDSEINPKEYE